LVSSTFFSSVFRVGLPREGRPDSEASDDSTFGGSGFLGYSSFLSFDSSGFLASVLEGAASSFLGSYFLTSCFSSGPSSFCFRPILSCFSSFLLSSFLISSNFLDSEAFFSTGGTFSDFFASASFSFSTLEI